MLLLLLAPLDFATAETPNSAFADDTDETAAAVAERRFPNSSDS